MKLKIGICLSILLISISGYAIGATPGAGWYPELTQYNEVSKVAVLPRPNGVAIIDSRPAARKFDKGHIPGSISIPDRLFDEMTDKLPADKSDLLIFYCGGLKCMLSHKSAFKAEKRGYTNIKVYADGYPDWIENGGLIGVSVAHIKKLVDKQANMLLIDSRPKKRKYDRGHIPGAISIPDMSFDKMTDKLPADKATPLYFYCGGMKCKLSSKSARKAIKLGYTKARIIPEGYPAWKKACEDDTATKSPQLKICEDGDSITVNSFKNVFKTEPETLLMVDVRDREEFSTGSFKGAVNIPIDDFEKRMDELTGNRIIVFYCSTAGRAGEAYDILKMFKPKMKSYFLNAEITFHPDGNYTIVELE